jgi:anti-sigma regulatory factor (Ser/Thr protein kinase)
MHVSEDRPAVRLELASRPETLTLVRGALGGVAELLALDPELLDDLKTAISEACNNVVLHAYDGDTGPLAVCIYVEQGLIEVIVRDQGVGIPSVTTEDDRVQGVGLPVIRALTQDAEFTALPGGGTEVRMVFAGEREGKPLFQRLADPAPDDGWVHELSGETIVSLSPIDLLGGVLGRLARVLAARARFSLDRFSDVYLVTDAIAAHAATSANGPRIGFGIATDERRLDLTIGPFRIGTAAQLGRDVPAPRAGPALTLLSDELDVRQAKGAELLHVVMVDQRRGSPRAGPT